LSLRHWSNSTPCRQNSGIVETLLADTGYFSAAKVKACADAGIGPLIAMGRQAHYEPLAERFAPAPPAPIDPTPVDAIAHALKTPEGKALYALQRVQTRRAPSSAGTVFAT